VTLVAALIVAAGLILLRRAAPTAEAVPARD